MADYRDQDQDTDYVEHRRKMLARFVELGGGDTMDISLAKMPKLEDHVTPLHRQMVKDLTAGGMDHEHIAKVMGISKERLQALFDYELAIGFALAEAGLARSLYAAGISGNTAAASSWLRYHKKSQWSDKKEMTDKGAKQEEDRDVAAVKAANDIILRQLIEGIAGDEKLVKAPTKKAQTETQPVAKIAPKKPTKAVIKKVKGD